MTAANSIPVRGQVPGLAVYGHTDVQGLRGQIFDQRDKVSGINQNSYTNTAGSSGDATEKITALKNMLDNELITQEDFDNKKQSILASM